MIFLAVFLTFSFVFLFFYGLLFMMNKDKMVLKDRMENLKNMDKVSVSHGSNDSFTKRAFGPIVEIFNGLIRKFSQDTRIEKVNKKLESAGLGSRFTYESWIYFNIKLQFIVAGLLGIIFYVSSKDILSTVLFVLFGIVFALALVRFYVSGKITKKKVNIVRDLPFTLDLITVSVEAGLSFDGAITRVINNIPGYLSEEFAKTLKEMKMGIERKVALRNMSERNDIKELSMLITSLIQADSLGVSLGNVLRIESEQLRETRKQIAKEKALKAPVKMLFPLILFIFPTIFIIILGPAIIQMVEMFSAG